MSTKNELRDQIIREMNARRIDHKTYINSEWLLSEYEKALDAEIDTNTMSTKTDEEILTEFNKTFRGCDQCQYGDGQGEWIERWLRTLITTLRKEQEEAVIKAFKEGQEDGAVNRGERRRIIEQLRTEVQDEAYTKGYNAGLADGTGKPLLAIEQIREEAVAEAKRKHGAEKFIDGMVAATQWLIDNKHIAAGSELNRMMLAAIAPQNTKTDTTNNDKRDEDQHREQCEGRY